MTSSLAILLLPLAVGGVVWVVLTQLSEKADTQAALRRLGEDDVVDERAVLLAASRVERILRPMLGGLGSSGRRLTPLGYRDKVAKRLSIAGRPGEDELDRFLAIRVATLAAAPIAALLVLKFFGSGKPSLAVAGLLVMSLVLLPGSRITREAQARQKAIAKALPDVLDLLVISIEAGLGFEQALDRTITAIPGPLTDEFARMLGEVRAGATRASSLRDLSDRVDVDDVRRFVLAVLQADKFGVSIGRMLRQQADEVRVQRRQRAQERAQKAPVKMLVPMVFCIFPCIFVVIIGPAILNLMQNFK
ncbi:MAG: tight adherence protein [Actinomycetota bacterium]|jgi:tight adherence protein C